jgi:hypothetical protein
MKIELLKIEEKPDAKAHKFPVQIAFQTMELMQGAIFHYIVSDTASGQRVRQPNALNEMEGALLAEGMKKSDWNDGWKYLKKYQEIFTKNVLQSVLITLRSHWDWYISHLGGFMDANYVNAFDHEISSNKKKDLSKIGFKEITQQIDILGKVLGEDIEVDDSIRNHLNEMSMVRNLGLHNRWEVDQYYVDKTKSTGWSVREIRTFEVAELELWHSSLIALIHNTWKPVAIKYNGTPAYEI